MKPGQIVDKCRVPGFPRIHVVGCYERRTVSICLQQTRALNAVYSLWSEGVITRGQRVAVIGGGFSGMTAAAALGRLGVKVTLIERLAKLLAYQRNNRTRWLHPRIHEWPATGSRDPEAHLPLLSWRAALSADVAAGILRQFADEMTRSSIEVRVKTAVELGHDGNAPMVKIRGDTESFDHVVLTIGLGVERTFGNLPLSSYWARPPKREPTADSPIHHLVSGIGEAGLIEAVYLRLRDFSHGDITDRIAELVGEPEFRAALERIHTDCLAREQAGEPVDEFSRAAWQALKLPAGFDEMLRSRLRPHTKLTLNGPENGLLAFRGDTLNRLLSWRLLSIGAISYRVGHLTSIVPPSRQRPLFEVQFDDGESTRFDEVHIRHGVVPSLEAAFPAIWEPYKPHREAFGFDETPEPVWPDGFYRDR